MSLKFVLVGISLMLVYLVLYANPQGVQADPSKAANVIDSPLKQFKSGVGISDIVCNKGLYLAVKSHDQGPICLKAGTISKLASRGFLYSTNTSNPNYTTIIIPPGSENSASHNTYSPDSATVVLGINNTVRWVNQADTANTIVPDMPLFQNGISFGSDGVIKPRQSYQFTFTEPGTFAYHTEPHPWMKGSVTVLVPRLKMEITGLNQSYEVNNTIAATIKYMGYEHDGVYPDVKILDASGTQVWNNCCIAHTETPTMFFGTFTYGVEGPLGHPVINKTGTYTMVASLDNATASAIFNVMSPDMAQSDSAANLKSDTGIVTWKNQAYYFETPNYTKTASSHELIVFHDVIFTLFPSNFGGLPLGSCKGTHYLTDAKFSDGTREVLHIFLSSSSCGEDYVPIKLSDHKNPQAGLIFYDGKVRLLVSASANSTGTNDTTKPVMFEVRNHGGSQRVDCGSLSELCSFSETDYFSGNVGQVKTGLPVQVSISDPYDMLVHQLTVQPNNIASDGSFNFTHTFDGKFGQDVYTMDFVYGSQKYELRYTPIPPLQR